MTIPNELQRSTPRPVSLSRKGWAIVLSSFLYLAVLTAICLQKYTQPGRDPFGPAIGVAMIVLATVANFARLRRQQRILMYGRAALARITEDATPGWFRLRRARTRPRRLACEFPLLGGGTCKTTVETRNYNPGPSNEIVIVYDPDEPRKAVLYPTLLLTVNAR
jgi:hypothetical protein